ncbi:MAG: DUF2778 domain-containing protein [Candidatus Sungbacteria bacterium]|uniref:DUF2778 domain-containing protein n=1 Tax=Candidatus Sungiibacteriota bacterium TaxID=2750080 RepID=A0A932QXS6_9BACT|nr:DUF2778 domain-containing protein [Candidatus Sungbacteria bacterium]
MTYLWFDGVQLHVIRNGIIIKSWNAYSGLLGATKSVEDQRLKNNGPVPEGCYSIHPGAITYQENVAWYRRWIKYRQSVWGRCWTKLGEECSTTCRSGFYIHGSGSTRTKGCIKLLDNDLDFCSWLSGYGKKTCVIVHYLPETRQRVGPALLSEVIARQRAEYLPKITILADVCECCREEKKEREKDTEKDEDTEKNEKKSWKQKLKTAVKIAIVLIIVALIYSALRGRNENSFRNCIINSFADPGEWADCNDGPGGDGQLKDSLINGRHYDCNRVRGDGECVIY